MQRAMPGLEGPNVQGSSISQSAGEKRLYGALLDDLSHDAEAARSAMSKRRRRANCTPLLLALMLPWVVFVLCFAIAAFFVHYALPLTTTLAELAILAVCIQRVFWAWRMWKRGVAEGFYPAYISLATLVAAVVGWGMGDFTFYSTMEPSYSAQLMVPYTEVDPSSTRLPNGEVMPTSGGRFGDAGKVYFHHDTVLDVNKSFSFKMADVYCVAPIKNKLCREPCGHDFWAVGKNCCAEDGSNFTCGDAGSRRAKSGLRLMENTEVPFYRLAVLQAASKFKMDSPHPIFFHWLEDPVAEIYSWQRQGFRCFALAMVGAFLVSGAALAYVVKGMDLAIG